MTGSFVRDYGLPLLGIAAPVGVAIWQGCPARGSGRNPQVLVESIGHPTGPHLNAHGQIAGALYEFYLSNTGAEVAVFDDNPLRGLPLLDIMKSTLRRRPLPRILLGLPEGDRFPTLLPPGGPRVRVRIVLARANHAAMEDPFPFAIYYRNAWGRRYHIAVKIRPRTGEVVSARAEPERFLPWRRRDRSV